MNKLIRGMCLTVMLAGLTTATAWGQTRIGTVDFTKLLEGYWKTKQAEDALKERGADLDKEFKGLRDEYQKTREEYQKLQAQVNDQAVSKEERDRRKQAADAKLRNLKDAEESLLQFERQARTTIEEQRRRLRGRVVDEIRTVLNARAKAAGYHLVVDVSAKSGNNTLDLISMAARREDPTDELAKSLPVVLYASGENDLTSDVLAELNAGAPVEALKSAEKKK